MPFGLKNAPATFQRAVNIILSRFKWYHAFVYIDYAIIYSHDVRVHFNNVHEVLSILKDPSISLNLSECQLFESSVDYIGHVIQTGKLKMASNNPKEIYLPKLAATIGNIRKTS